MSKLTFSKKYNKRANYSEAREALFAVTIPEKKGSFLAFCKVLGKRSITEFNYRYSSSKEAHIFVGLALTAGKPERLKIQETFKHHGYETEDLTENDMAKLHIRHMVGGRLNSNEVERIYRFEFPERPGALLNFLNRMGQKDSVFEYVLKYAYIAKSSGLDGIVCSPLETELIKKSFGSRIFYLRNISNI